MLNESKTFAVFVGMPSCGVTKMHCINPAANTECEFDPQTLAQKLGGEGLAEGGVRGYLIFYTLF